MVITRILGLLAALWLALAAMPASANNIPGSAASALPEATEIATGMIVRSLKEHILPLREGGDLGSVAISPSGYFEGLAFSAGGALGPALSLRLQYRDLDTERLDGGVGGGTLLLGHSINNRTMIFGGLIMEHLDVDTPYNRGRIDGDGVGFALGIDHRINSAFYVTGIVGAMGMEYDVSRNSGAFTGSFDASRNFVDLSGDYTLRVDPVDIMLGFGLLYVRQKNDPYVESGGATVAGFTSDQLSGRLSARGMWGHQGAIRPYVEAETWFRLSGSSGLPAMLDPGDTRDWNGRLGVGLQKTGVHSGFALGLGANIGTDGFEGLDAKVSYSHRF